MSEIKFTVDGKACVAKPGQTIVEAARDALAHGLGLDAEVRRFTDLDDLAGSWIEDPEFDRVIADMDRIDEAMWK